MRALATGLMGTLVLWPALLAAQQPARPSLAARLEERASQTRDIVYFLRPPESHAFDLYHDYTEAREGVDRYLNVVRAGSTVSDPSARNLDTGEPLPTRILVGDEITKAGLEIGEAVTPATQVVLISFPPVKRGQTMRLRIR